MYNRLKNNNKYTLTIQGNKFTDLHLPEDSMANVVGIGKYT